ncbi:LTA synthase family protein [Candidatus Tisiphia endosymbiont of Oplodontha viridula]|uniref:LTA synthase family protein n=1 Tax=Candidatus Tisiphia endosymbiont of Oplodontha viridula TaxID=3077925 RepID=UPI0035C8FA00
MIKTLFNFPIIRIYLIFQFITRIILSSYALWQQQITISDLASIFVIGIFNDLISLCYFLPVILLLIIGFYKLLARYKFLYLSCCFVGYFCTVALLTFITIAEITFWDEFGVRFNFIAVDYLIYTHEIIGTVKESMPYREILLAIIIVALLISFLLRKYIINQANIANLTNITSNLQASLRGDTLVATKQSKKVIISGLLRRLMPSRNDVSLPYGKKCFLYALTLFLFSLVAFNFYNPNKIDVSSNKYAIELARNGYYQFFSAYFNNSLDYNNFYPVIDKNQALNIVRSNLSQDESIYSNDSTIERNIRANPSIANPTNITLNSQTSQVTKNGLLRQLTPPRNDNNLLWTNTNQVSHNSKKYNVIFITVESLSSEFMGKFGNQQNITPNLDRLAEQSIFFTNLYAVGTRTVRGLEAITLSVPPTPGSSIIRRPDNQSLFNIATIFKNQGYAINFLFGGYSYFDNLQNYFHGNGYNIVDQGNLKSHEISFSNIWGVADEDILIKSLELADQNYKQGKAFFSLIMTVSNHRPYTFTEGRIDLPSGSGRSAAVKYTDYAIGKFLALAKTHPWFDNTIFVITADHCASSAGKTDLPVNKYHIPLLIYAPNILKPQIVDNLASQIDIAPTILGLLNFSYNSKFFGQDILNMPANRAFISTYQLLGFMKDNHLVVLRPQEQAKTYKLIAEDKIEVENIPSLVEEAISFYQVAYDLYIRGEMRE